ncbi:MAG: ARMT1-like domain-containing protein [Campylobacteraceae bacterium]|jgi:uncharacterized protein with ATP-grasp and redox domains|nr:ARMT1-like domain-containing protein [Campylobacteraceae bacterium]
MKIEKECKDCILAQAVRAGEVLNLNTARKKAIIALAKKHIKNFDYTLTPPENAYKLYEEIASFLNTKDIYKEIKTASTKRAEELLDECEAILQNAPDTLLGAAKIAVAGNVIDLASRVQYDLKEEIKNIADLKFEIDDFWTLKNALANAREIVYICDNAGEEVFDKLFIRTIKRLYPSSKIYYFTRGKPIINDITYEDALNSGLDEYAEVMDSGVPTPGFVYSMASCEAREKFKHADVIIAKGMGNFECMSENERENIFYLFKVKCKPVGRFAKANLGSIVCKKTYLPEKF